MQLARMHDTDEGYAVAVPVRFLIEASLGAGLVRWYVQGHEALRI